MNDRLDKIDDMARKATPGPWRANASYGHTEHGVVVRGPGGVDKQLNNDAAFIAVAREDVRWLVARLRQAEMVLLQIPCVRLRDDALGWQCPGCGASTGIRSDGAHYHEHCAPDCWVTAAQDALNLIREPT